MESICLGNNLYLKLKLRQDKIGNCRFFTQPKIKSVHYCMDNRIDVHAAVNGGTIPEYVKLELEIYNPEQSRCCIQIAKEDGESEIFLLENKYTNLKSFGNKGDFVLTTNVAPESAILEETFGQCSLYVSTWKLIFQNPRCSREMLRAGNDCIAGGSDIVNRRTETDGCSSSAAHFAVAGHSSQTFTAVPLEGRDFSSIFKSKMCFFWQH
mgnify:CR=1 FL=1